MRHATLASGCLWIFTTAGRRFHRPRFLEAKNVVMWN